MTNKVALITGGASGIGLATAHSLASTGSWTLHLLDLNQQAGDAAAQALADKGAPAHFHAVNVTSYASLSGAFEAVFTKEGRIDFVFANAGIVERHSFYEIPPTAGSAPPPAPNLLTLDINLNAAVTTAYLALHYFRQSPHRGQGTSLVMTASCGGIYPSEFCPVYSASKAGVVHFMRSIAFSYHKDGIRSYAICPGTVRTNLLLAEEWKSFPEEYFTPIDKIASTVQMLVDGGALEDSTGRRFEADRAYGLAVEISGANHYFRDQLDYCNDNMRRAMVATSMENQQAAFDEVKRREAKTKKIGGDAQHVEHAAA